jgi:hypothetical protein
MEMGTDMETDIDTDMYRDMDTDMDTDMYTAVDYGCKQDTSTLSRFPLQAATPPPPLFSTL